MDIESRQPVVFATVRIKGKALGVISNTDGGFKIPLKHKLTGEVLEISSMGYEKIEVPLSMFNDKTILAINMKPALFELNEVTVSKRRRRAVNFSAREIVYKAIENLPNNVSMEPYSYVGYYRDYQLKNESYNNLNEALLQVYDQGFNISDYETSKIRIFDYRQNTDFPIDTLGLKPYDYSKRTKTISNATLSGYGGNEFVILRIHNPIRNYKINSFDFVNRFDSDFTRNHTFYKEEDVIVNGEYLYHVSFELLGTKVEVKGDLYITQDNFAITGFNYITYKKQGKGDSEKTILFETKVEYIEEGGKMYLSYHSMNNSFRLATPPKLQLEDTTLDLNRNQFILEFTNLLDEKSASRLSNYDIIFNGEPLKFDAITIIGNEVSLIPDLDNKKSRDLFREIIYLANRDKITSENLRIELKRIKDEKGNLINEPDYENRKQFREFFVQELQLESSIVPKDNLLMKKNRPLFKNQPINKPDNFKDYWMNTPLPNIKN
ncbi:carboxypeptidase-like regulatory domain-containing protein [Maribacter cobaltidurans]|uniref:carboxypeptidase-like regulatory domain-containing protein n=1 Tax=Maribacter cobaltidurans TaxID=1178778 RepID=UPI00131568C9|nr:carboxypeptidase-like regulatory domain-containing protein [Maribacter cobaltidurans]GGD71360.1 hypothetical protein GCM10011412_06190 [Maribacter cobaltidurans]